jgi:hypothetical protein
MGPEEKHLLFLKGIRGQAKCRRAGSTSAGDGKSAT